MRRMNFAVRFWNAKRAIARALGCGMLLVLTSCQIPPLRQEQSGPNLPENFNIATNGAVAESANGAAIGGAIETALKPGIGPAIGQALGAVIGAAIDANTPENSAQLDIEEFFNDPTLTQLIYGSLAGNQELKILAEDIQIANNEILGRSGAYLPFVGIGGGAGL